MKLGLLHNIVPTLTALSVGFSLSAVSACSATDTRKALDVTKITLDIGDAICQVLEQHPEMPDKVRIACQYVDKADGLSHLFLATVPKAQAHAMGYRMACGSSAPAASSSSK